MIKKIDLNSKIKYNQFTLIGQQGNLINGAYYLQYITKKNTTVKLQYMELDRHDDYYFINDQIQLRELDVLKRKVLDSDVRKNINITRFNSGTYKNTIQHKSEVYFDIINLNELLKKL